MHPEMQRNIASYESPGMVAYISDFNGCGKKWQTKLIYKKGRWRGAGY